MAARAAADPRRQRPETILSGLIIDLCLGWHQGIRRQPFESGRTSFENAHVRAVLRDAQRLPAGQDSVGIHRDTPVNHSRMFRQSFHGRDNFLGLNCRVGKVVKGGGRLIADRKTGFAASLVSI